MDELYPYTQWESNEYDCKNNDLLYLGIEREDFWLHWKLC